MAPKFIQRYKEGRCDSTLYKGINGHTNKPELIIVIPAYKESQTQLLQTIASINTNEIAFSVLVLILINYKETDDSIIKENSIKLYKALSNEKLSSNHNITYQLFCEEMNGKKSGVGLARKQLMDTAFLLFQESESDGIIVNLDADTLVDNNYLNAIKTYFLKHNKMEAANIPFYHCKESITDKPTDLDPAITNYELHLRYFINMQRWVGLPYAYQTIGSAMAVRSNAYAKEGGMNTRQAGEDFYFLHKFSKNWSLGEINDSIVYPSCRASDRVPFGTGKAVAEYEQSGQHYLHSYNPHSFVVLKEWIQQIEPLLYNKEPTSFPVPDDSSLKRYLDSNEFNKAIDAIVVNSSPGMARVKSFYNWFDGFKLFKYLHYARDNGRPSLPIIDCLETYFNLTSIEGVPTFRTEKNNIGESEIFLQLCLEQMRKHDLTTDYNDQWRAALISRLSKT